MIATESQSRSTSSSWCEEKITGTPRARDLLVQGAAERVDAVGVEAGEGLVEDQQVGLVDQRQRQLHPLLVAERERLDRLVGALARAPARASQRSAAASAVAPRSTPCRRAM